MSAAQAAEKEPAFLRVGAAAVDLEADDAMVIAGGIGPGKVNGQEGKLRALAIILQKDQGSKLAVVTCDILMITRDLLDPVVRQIEDSTGIRAGDILIACTHTHHAPSTMRVHAYDRDESFCRTVQRAIVAAVEQANANLSPNNSRFFFRVGEEKTVGQNSRVLLEDGLVYWVGTREGFVRPTGPFDPELPVLAFRGPDQQLRALFFNHSTHTIGTRQAGKRSPGFYGLAAQELEAELGGLVGFLEGASGSTHNLTLTGEEAAKRIKEAVATALSQAEPRGVERLACLKRPFRFKVRQFDEDREEQSVAQYCRKYLGAHAEEVCQVFRNMRRTLAPQRGQERETWVQTMLIGDVALVGVPAELFTQLGLDIKNRSPFRYTCVVELANDWIGYLPNWEGHKLGGYQVWTGYHSYAEPGAGERLVDQAVAMLREMQK